MTRTYLSQDTTATVTAPTYEELDNRIREVIDFHGGRLPLEHALVWEGYVFALLEWQLISVHDHEKLLKIIGKTLLEPGLTISLGPDGARKFIEDKGKKKAVASSLEKRAKSSE